MQQIDLNMRGAFRRASTAPYYFWDIRPLSKRWCTDGSWLFWRFYTPGVLRLKNSCEDLPVSLQLVAQPASQGVRSEIVVPSMRFIVHLHSQSKFERPLNVLVLQGGASAEREISLKSGKNISESLKYMGHRVTLHDPQQQLPTPYWLQQFDCAFIALHGGDGEDGTIQAILEKASIPFTGCSSETAALTMNKWQTKVRLNDAKLPVPFGVLFFSSSKEAQIIKEVSQLEFPLVVKPNQQGSSLGITLIHTLDELLPAFQHALAFDDEVLIEQAKLGHEWTVSVLDRMAFPALKICYTTALFDYHAKYEGDETQYLFASDQEATLARKLESLAVKACQAVGTRGIVRVDFRHDNSGNPFILEINSVPGMTAHSLVPKAAKQVGWSMTELCEEIIHRAIKRLQTDEFPKSVSA